MSKKSSFIQPLLKSWQTLTALIVVSVIVVSSGVDKSVPINLLGIPPAMATDKALHIAQRISPGDIWEKVYQQLPDLPKENQYISRETGQVAENNTLVSRLIRYHLYTKGRAPNYRLDWKFTLADYLDANETMYDHSYPGSDTLRQNPLVGDRQAIANLNRHQRNVLIQVLVDIFNPNPENTPTPNNRQTPNPNSANPSPLLQPGSAELLK
jgi:hypothetical protein